MDFDQIYLSPKESRVMKKISRGPVPENEVDLQLFFRLAHFHFVKMEGEDPRRIALTDIGLDYLHFVAGRRWELARTHVWDAFFVLMGAVLTLLIQAIAQ